MLKQVVCNTKKDKGAQAVRTEIAYDFTGVTLDDLVAGWIDGATIRLQSKWRRGDAPIPSKVTVKVKDMCAGRVSEVLTAEGVLDFAKKMTDAERAALIAKLQGK